MQIKWLGECLAHTNNLKKGNRLGKKLDFIYIYIYLFKLGAVEARFKF